MRGRGALLSGAVVLLDALYNASPAAGFAGLQTPAPILGVTQNGRQAATRHVARVRFAAQPAARVLGAVGLRAAEDEVLDAQAQRARSLIEEVRLGAASRLDRRIEQIKNPAVAEASSNTTASSGGQKDESREEKMARARALADKVRGGSGADKKSGDPPMTSTGIGGTW